MPTPTSILFQKRLHLAYQMGGILLSLCALGVFIWVGKDFMSYLLLGIVWVGSSVMAILSFFIFGKTQVPANLAEQERALAEKTEHLKAMEEETRLTFEQIQIAQENLEKSKAEQAQTLLEKTEHLKAMEEETRLTLEQIQIAQENLEKSKVEQAQTLLEKTEHLKAMEEETRLTFEQIQVAQELLEKSEQALRGRMEAINRTMSVCEIDLKGFIVEVNTMMLQALKLTRDEIVGKHYQTLIDDHFKESALYELILISLDNKIGYSGDIKVLGKGTEIWFNLTLTPVFSKSGNLERVVILGNDITITKLKNIEYEATMKALQQFNPVAEFDLQGNFLRANGLFLNLLGYKKAKIKPQDYREFTPKEHHEELEKVWQKLQIGKYVEAEFPHTVIENGVIWLNSSFTPILDLNEKPNKVIWIATDITERKKYEMQIKSQNEDIMGSIEYAQRIQMAMLPTHDVMSEHLRDFFVLYLPKDIVSGDFYWFEVIDNKIFVIAVDCTGHGVPGAFMSMLGNEILHEIIGIRGIYATNEIIANLHLNIRKSLKQHETKNHEGMDIGVAVIDKRWNRLEFAGAKNNLWIVKNNEVQEIRGGWKGAGGYETDKVVHYEQHFVALEPNMKFYMHSDGYIDQFGGAQGKKFGTKRFKALLESCHHLSMAEQKKLFHQTLEDWRGESRDNQIDDIMLLGIKI
jgi:PAS domain S-box-containing protein